MTEYEFELTFALPEGETDGAKYLDALYAAGCDDAFVGLGRPGTISLDFTREANSAEVAVNSAIDNVRNAIPGAVLVDPGWKTAVAAQGIRYRLPIQQTSLFFAFF